MNLRIAYPDAALDSHECKSVGPGDREVEKESSLRVSSFRYSQKLFLIFLPVADRHLDLRHRAEVNAMPSIADLSKHSLVK